MSEIIVRVTLGAERRTWCEQCALSHIAITVWGYTAGDPSKAQVLGVISDCEQDQ